MWSQKGTLGRRSTAQNSDLRLLGYSARMRYRVLATAKFVSDIKKGLGHPHRECTNTLYDSRLC